MVKLQYIPLDITYKLSKITIKHLLIPKLMTISMAIIYTIITLCFFNIKNQRSRFAPRRCIKPCPILIYNLGIQVENLYILSVILSSTLYIHKVYGKHIVIQFTYVLVAANPISQARPILKK